MTQLIYLVIGILLIYLGLIGIKKQKEYWSESKEPNTKVAKFILSLLDLYYGLFGFSILAIGLGLLFFIKSLKLI